MLPIDSKPALASIHGLHSNDQLALYCLRARDFKTIKIITTYHVFRFHDSSKSLPFN